MGELRTAFIRECRRAAQRWPRRLQGLAADCSNTGPYALHLGMPLEEFSPARKLACGFLAPPAAVAMGGGGQEAAALDGGNSSEAEVPPRLPGAEATTKVSPPLSLAQGALRARLQKSEVFKV